MPVICGQTYHKVITGEYITVLEPHPRAIDFWFTAIAEKRHIPMNINGNVQAGNLKFHSDSAIMHAWYSATAEKSHGSWAVVGIGGNVVRVTVVSCLPNLVYNWTDKQYLGEVYQDTRHDECIGTSASYTVGGNKMTGNVIGNLLPNIVPMQFVGHALNTTTTTKPSKPLQLGDICPVCNKEWKRRELFIGAYIGCWC